jgi:hypothetical protein
VKVVAKTFPKDAGPSSNWRLFVEYLTRAGEVMPEEGVSFTVIVTISDPDAKQPVFNDRREPQRRSNRSLTETLDKSQS